jgi:SAM-dependent methyltransferase
MKIKRHFDLLRRSLYLLPHWQILIVRLRLFWFVRVRKALRFHESNFAFETTIMNNLKGLKHYNGRTDTLIRPLSVIESVDPNSRLLIIGPRNEHDLFSAIGHGFHRDRVRGLDLISYSPMIDLGDMHDTPYPDDSFDAVVVGWTLSYSREPRRFAEEMMRIVRDGGLIAIGVEYSTLTEEDSIALSGYSIQESEYLDKRINSTADILELFGEQVKDVFFNHDAPLRRSHTRAGMIENVSKVAVIFSIRKG